MTLPISLVTVMTTIADINYYGDDLLGNVLHHLELSTRGVDLADGARLELVDELAEDSAVPDDILVGLVRRELSTKDGFDPLLSFLLLLRITLGGQLMDKWLVLIYFVWQTFYFEVMIIFEWLWRPLCHDHCWCNKCVYRLNYKYLCHEVLLLVKCFLLA